jgi:16S rRNA G966 N2-methylase RsmD
LVKKACALLREKDLISNKSIICTEVEKEKELNEILLEWDLVKSKVAGQTRYCLLKKKNA